MKIHYLQHVPYEGLGSTKEWALARGHELSATRLYAGEALPDSMAFDWLFVMGGPMNIYEYQDHPWLKPEKAFIRQAINNGKKVFGICLGSQLISDVLGGPVVNNGEMEIGWFPIRRRGEPRAPLELLLPDSEGPAFHWHGDRFQLPEGAEPFAESEGCPNQGFTWGSTVFAFQFHPEVTPEVARVFAEQSGELPSGRFVQTLDEMVAEPDRFERVRERWFGFLDGLAG